MSTSPPKKLVIIGCAPTALGFAYRLNELIAEGNAEAKQVQLTIVEQESFAGGLSHSERDDKGFLWDMGGHVTFSENCPYYEKATRWALADWNSLQRHCLVDMNYLFGEKGIHLVPYPAQFAVPLFPEKIKQACLTELKERYEKSDESAAAPVTFEDWILKNFGPTILNQFFKPYTKKVWTVDTAKMSPNWVGTRVAKLPQDQLEKLCAMTSDELTKADLGWGPNACFTFPKYGGTGAVWQNMANKLPQEWIRYNQKCVGVDYKNKRITVQKKDGSTEELPYDALVNTTPVDLLVKETGICPELNVEHNKVFIVGVGLELPMPEHMKTFTWLYFPDPDVPFYRVTFLSRYGEVTPDSSKYWSVMVECARQPDDPVTEEQIRDAAVQGLITKQIITKEQIVSVYSTTLPYGYPIPTVERDSEMARAHRVLEAHDIYSRGRFGGWKYEVSNQDHVFMQGKEIAERLILGQEEKVYRTGLTEKRG